MSKLAWVVGEALIDLIQDVSGIQIPKVGGGPANTSKAIARLGYETSLIGGLSSDSYGQLIEEELKSSGVDLTLSYRGHEPTALATATLDDKGAASYEFELAGTATFAFDELWLPHGDSEVIHIGSVATMLEPGASELLKWARSKSAPIIFDPNVRPSIEGNKDLYRASVERWIDVASIVKLSEDDLDWLYGDESVVQTWFSRGVSLVVVTR